MSSVNPASPVRRSLRYVAATFAFSWAAMVPVVLHARHAITLPGPLFPLLAALGSAGPSIVALVLVLFDGDGARSLLAKKGASPIGRRLAVAGAGLVFPVACHVVGAGVAVLFGAPMSLLTTFGTPGNGDQIGIAIVAPLGEEFGWRGYLQRRLGAGVGALKASLVVGPVWALWHLPMYFAQPQAAGDLVVASVFILAGAVVFALLFELSGRSMLVPVVAHLGVHLDNVTRLGGGALYATTAAAVVVGAASAHLLSRLAAPRSP